MAQENVFMKYMTDRLKMKEPDKKVPGPVITVSRQYGCYGSQIASKLADALSKESKKINPEVTWDYISKEVLEDAANHLDAQPDDIAHIFGANEKSFWRDLKESLTLNKYTSDSNIKRTIGRVVKKYAIQGHCVIVGRAGCILAKDIEKSFHIKIYAPDKWRIERIKKRFNISYEEAEKNVREVDAKREVFMKFFRGDKPDNEIFDVMFNRSTLNDEEIIDAILDFMRLRKLFV